MALFKLHVPLAAEGWRLRCSWPPRGLGGLFPHLLRLCARGRDGTSFRAVVGLRNLLLASAEDGATQGRHGVEDVV